jgi:hypothetical protein
MFHDTFPPQNLSVSSATFLRCPLSSHLSRQPLSVNSRTVQSWILFHFHRPCSLLITLFDSSALAHLSFLTISPRTAVFEAENRSISAGTGKFFSILSNFKFNGGFSLHGLFWRTQSEMGFVTLEKCRSLATRIGMLVLHLIPDAKKFHKLTCGALNLPTFLLLGVSF